MSSTPDRPEAAPYRGERRARQRTQERLAPRARSRDGRTTAPPSPPTAPRRRTPTCRDGSRPCQASRSTSTSRPKLQDSNRSSSCLLDSVRVCGQLSVSTGDARRRHRDHPARTGGCRHAKRMTIASHAVVLHCAGVAGCQRRSTIHAICVMRALQFRSIIVKGDPTARSVAGHLAYQSVSDGAMSSRRTWP